MMKFSNLIVVSCILLSFSASSTSNVKIAASKDEYKTYINQTSHNLLYAQVKVEYDTLIPIFTHLFLTYYEIDSINYLKYAVQPKSNSIGINYSEEITTGKIKKWGVIDSVGNVIIPFICDGVKEISENQGVVSVYAASASLNTGIPRYQYMGTTYFFNKNGILTDTKKDFMITIEYFTDYHNSAYVIQKGPTFYLPNEYRSSGHY